MQLQLQEAVSLPSSNGKRSSLRRWPKPTWPKSPPARPVLGCRGLKKTRQRPVQQGFFFGIIEGPQVLWVLGFPGKKRACRGVNVLQESGVLGPVVGTIGSMAALEVLKAFPGVWGTEISRASSSCVWESCFLRFASQCFGPPPAIKIFQELLWWSFGSCFHKMP